MVTKIELFKSPNLTPLDFCLWSWMKSEVHKSRVDTWDELFGHVLGAAARIKSREDQLLWATSNLCWQVSKCIEVDGILKNLLWTEQICHLCITYLLFKHEIKIKIKLTVSDFSLFITIHNGFFIGGFKQLYLGNHS